MKRHQRGALLLEVLAALTVFGVAALGTLSLISQMGESELRVQAAERRIADMDRLLTAYTLLERRDLDLRLGARTVGAYVVEVQRPAPALYRISIGENSAVDLATLVFRP